MQAPTDAPTELPEQVAPASEEHAASGEPGPPAAEELGPADQTLAGEGSAVQAEDRRPPQPFAEGASVLSTPGDSSLAGSAEGVAAGADDPRSRPTQEPGALPTELPPDDDALPDLVRPPAEGPAAAEGELSPASADAPASSEHDAGPVPPQEPADVRSTLPADPGSAREPDVGPASVGDVTGPPSSDGEHPRTALPGHAPEALEESSPTEPERLTDPSPVDGSSAGLATAVSTAGEAATDAAIPAALSGTDEPAPVVAEQIADGSEVGPAGPTASTDVADPAADRTDGGGTPDRDLAAPHVAAGVGAALEGDGLAATAGAAEGSAAAAVTSPPLDQEPWAGLPAEIVDEAEPDEPAQTDRGSGRDRARLVLLTLTAVAVVAAILLAVLVVVRHSREQSGTAAVNSSASRNAVVAAVNAAPALLSYDYRNTVAKQVATLAPLVTASCQASYTKDLNKLASTLNPLKVVEKAALLQPDTNAAGVESSADGRVIVLVFAELTTTNSRLSAPMVEAIQVSLTMEKQGSSWKVNGVVSKGSGGSNQSAC